MESRTRQGVRSGKSPIRSCGEVADAATAGPTTDTGSHSLGAPTRLARCLRGLTADRVTR